MTPSTPLEGLDTMKKFFSLILAAVGGLLASLILPPPLRTRAATRDVAYGFRMGAGFPGDVNRTHPASIVPGMINVTNPPAAYGNPVLVDTATNSLRGLIPADGSVTALAIYGVLVRPYPTQQSSGGMSSALGAATPPVSGVADFLRQGFIMAKLPAGVNVTKGGTVYARAAATSGNIIQGALLGAADGTNSITITNAQFTGPADANGNVEIEVWAAR